MGMGFHLLANECGMEDRVGQLAAILAAEIQGDQAEDELLQPAHAITGQLTLDAVGGRQKDLLGDERQLGGFDDHDALPVRIETGPSGPSDHLLVARPRQTRRSHVRRPQDHLSTIY